MIKNMEVDLRPELGAVRDQGARPTCLSHAVSTSHENARGTSIQMSAEYLHFFATGGNPSVGSTMSDVRSALEGNGQPEDRFCPGFAGNPPPSWKPPENVPVFRRRSTSVPPSWASVEDAIRAARAPVLGITLPRTFFRPDKPWVVAPGRLLLGLHAVLGVGLRFCHDQLLILIRNSWGLRWGDYGHALLAREFLDRHLIAVTILTEEAG